MCVHSQCYKDQNDSAGEMDQKVKEPATKADDLSLIPRAHMMSSDFHTGAHINNCPSGIISY